MSTPLLPEVVPEIDANPVSFYWGRGDGGKSTPTEHPQIASKVTEIDRISVVIYVSDHFVHRKLQLTHQRDPSTKLGLWVGTRLKRQKTT